MTPSFQVFILGIALLLAFWLIGQGGTAAIFGWFVAIAIGLYGVFVLIVGVIVCVGLGALIAAIMGHRK